MTGWVTTIELRQPAGLSHEVAYEQALGVAQELMARGADVTLGPTLRDEPLSTTEEIHEFMEGEEDDT